MKKQANATSPVFKTLSEVLEHRFTVTPAMLHSINTSGIIVAVSDAWLAKLGYDRHEVIGKKSADFLTQESRNYAISTVIPKFFETGHCENIEYQMVCKNGMVLDVLMSAVLDIDHVKKTHQSLCVITDITGLKAAKTQLAENEARYRILIEDQTELVSLATPDGRLLFVNDAYAKVYSLEPRAMVGKSLFGFIYAGARESVVAHFGRVVCAKKSIECRNQIVLPSGEMRWFSWSNRAIRGTSDEIVLIHSVGRDIQHQMEMEERLRESEANYRLLAENSSDMVFRLDRNLVRRYASPAFRDILGYDPGTMIGVRPTNMAHPDDAESVATAFRILLDGLAETASVTNRIRHRDGRWVWVEANLRVIKDADTGEVSGITGAMRDITKRKAIEEELSVAKKKLEAMVDEDALTGLSSRRAFDAALNIYFKDARRQKQHFALVMIDVDFFKAFNDDYGHVAGDECLRLIGTAIANSVHRPRDFVARYGGEEFVAILPQTDISGARTIGERIRKAVYDLEIMHGGCSNGIVTVSVGVAISSVGSFERSPTVLLEAADCALYRAKKAGRNIVFSDGDPTSRMVSAA